jgi:hypothetical protein
MFNFVSHPEPNAGSDPEHLYASESLVDPKRDCGGIDISEAGDGGAAGTPAVSFGGDFFGCCCLTTGCGVKLVAPSRHIGSVISGVGISIILTIGALHQFSAVA